jgi:hypothetical protein
MKTALLSILAFMMLAFVSVSCATHTTYHSVSEGPVYQTEGTFKRCLSCDGKGSCAPCKGTGRISGDACRNCKGSGKCPSCNGNGGYYTN